MLAIKVVNKTASISKQLKQLLAARAQTKTSYGLFNERA